MYMFSSEIVQTATLEIHCHNLFVHAKYVDFQRKVGVVTLHA